MEQTRLVVKVQIRLKIVSWFWVGLFIIEKKGRKRAGIVTAIDVSVWKAMTNNNIALDSGHYSVFLYDDRGYFHRTISMLVFFYHYSWMILRCKLLLPLKAIMNYSFSSAFRREFMLRKSYYVFYNVENLNFFSQT